MIHVSNREKTLYINKILPKSPIDSALISVYFSYFVALCKISRFAKITLTKFTRNLMLCTSARQFFLNSFFLSSSDSNFLILFQIDRFSKISK